MNESFVQFYKCSLKKTIKSVQTWIKLVAIFFVVILFLKKSGETSVAVYSYNVGKTIAVYALADVIGAFIVWAIKITRLKILNKSL